MAAAYSAHITNLKGGSTFDIVKAGAISGGAAYASGEIAGANLNFATEVAAHGVVGGAVSAASGGEFRDGFYAGAVTAAFSPAIDNIKGNSGPALFARVTVSAVIGGTASELSGGKFANGAYSAAFLQSVTEASGYYERTVGWKADASPGEYHPSGPNGECCSYEPSRFGRTPGPDTIVIGFNDPLKRGSWNLGKQGTFISDALNIAPIGNASAHLHDTWWNGAANAGIKMNVFTNVGTMPPAIAISLGAAIGNFTHGWQNNQMIWSSILRTNGYE